MAKIYADLIHKGLKTIDDVPDNLKSEVIKLGLIRTQRFTKTTKSGDVT